MCYETSEQLCRETHGCAILVRTDASTDLIQIASFEQIFTVGSTLTLVCTM